MCCFLSQPPSSIRGGGGIGLSTPQAAAARGEASPAKVMGAYCPGHKPCRDLRIGHSCAPRGVGVSSAHNGPHHTPHSGRPPVTDRIDNRARMVRLGNRADDSWLFLSSGVGLYRRDHVSPRAGPESGPMDGPLFFFVLHPQRGKVFSDSRASPVRRLISRPRSHLYCTPPQGI